MTPRWCAACRAAPASIYCPSDTAILCTACDILVHEANQLARRHTRVPLNLFDNMGVPQVEHSPPTHFHGAQSTDKSSSAATAFDESDESSGGGVVPDTDDLYPEHHTFADTQVADISLSPPTKHQQPSSWAHEAQSAPHPVADTNTECLKTIAGAFVKQEIQTLFESSQRQSPPKATHANGLDFLWMRDSLPPALLCDGTSTTLTGTRHGFDSKQVLSAAQIALQNSLDQSLLDDVLGSSLSTDEDISIPGADILDGLKIEGAALTSAERSREQKRLDRQAALRRFRHKRANRSFRKKVRYACRKQLADSRPRVKGRFVGRAKTTSTGRVQKKSSAMGVTG
ncbi:unnamed protein product [Chondrus crispus]|uniref:CCT domain-containing protein n=1 Tax=Chondrus crispus TaxID=2769 RepID=R7QSJ2_CHOCR|nr:unnamed protein product [Chondrus crispus]CDF40713.1 unnamed protein product [Chondrus crispus]|eukprot:XP_005711007.1 unnamed protein product [Chondrus crispus]